MKPTTKELRRLGLSLVTEKNGISEYLLKRNSLKILLAPDAGARTAVVFQHVRVGSRHEGAGTTGYAHLLEHMLFKGTPTRNRQLGNSYDEFVKAHGNVMNATTWFDRTNYFAQIPVYALGTYLEYEADRLRNAHITDSELASEMPVVVKEFEIGENEPEELLNKLIWGMAYTEHSYKVDTIGARSEVMKVTAGALKERFYDVYYWPNNVTLIVVGGDQSTVLRQIVHAYGSLSPSPRAIPTPYTVEPPQFGERRGVIRRPGDLAIVHMAFHVPETDHEDHFALAALCSLLGGSKASRLHRMMVDKGLAAEAYSRMHQTFDPGLFEVAAKLTPGVSAKKAEKTMLRQVEWFKKHLISAKQLASLKKQNLNGTLNSNAGQMNIAFGLSNHESCADWMWGEDYDANFDKLTAQDIQKAAQQYLTADNRTVGYFLPTGQAVPPREDGGEDAPKKEISDDITSPTFEKTVLYPLGGKPAKSYAEQMSKVVLPNGLTVLLMPTQKESALGFSMIMNAGTSRAPVDKRLVAKLTPTMLTSGSAAFSKKRIQELTTEMLVNFRFSFDRFDSTMSTLVPPADMPLFLSMLSDGLLNPSFAADEFALAKKQEASELAQKEKDPRVQASIAFSQASYPPESPFYTLSTDATKAQLEALSVEDLKAFHKGLGPVGTVISVVGKFDKDEMAKLIEEKFGSWTGGTAVSREPALSTISAAGQRKEVHIEGKDSISIVFGLPTAFSKNSPDYFAALIANGALGGDTMSSRLGFEIRERRGLTYGVYCSFTDEPVAGGPWAASMATDQQKLERSISLIGKIIKVFAHDGIGEKELAVEKSTKINQYAMSLDSTVAVARALANAEYEGVGVEYLDRFEDAIKAVTQKQVNEAIRRYFQADNATIAVAGTLK